MQNIDTTILEEIGLTNNEAKTYIELSRAGSITAGNLSKRVNMHRSRMYEALNRLIKLGLVHFVEINKITHYEARPPEKLLEIIKDRENRLEKIIPELKSIQKEPQIIQKIHAYQGIKGIKNLLTETLETKEYSVFGAPQSSLKILGQTYWKNYNQKIKDKKIKTRMIFDESLKEWSKEIIKINHGEIRFLDKHFENMTETFVYEDKVIIITWTIEPLAVKITDQTIAKSYKQFFEILWKQAKK
jgi:sugar-specific transcriptional regulator TrmB